MALPSSSLTDPGTATNGNATGDSLATPDKSKLTDYLNTLEHRNLVAGAGFTRIFREGTATSKGAKGSSFRNPKSIMAASGAGEEDEGLQCGHFVASPRSGYKRLGKEEDRALRVDNIYGTQSTSVERIDAGSGLNTSLLSPDEQSEAARGHERVAPRERHSSSASSLSLSSSSSSSAAVHHGPFSHSRTERSAPSQPISLGRKPFETASHGRRPHNRSASCNSDASGRIRCGNFASGRAAAIAWEELNMTQDALRETMDDLRELVATLNKKVNEVEMESKQRAKMQVAKDTAQDEILEMEMKQLSYQIAARLSRTELLDMAATQNQKLKSLETAILGVIDERAESLRHKMYGELEKVIKQLYTIQQAGEKGRNIVEDRVKQCVMDHARLEKELQKERREKEELQSQCKRLAEQLLQVESRQAETVMRQDAGLKSLEKQCNQCLIAESSYRQQDLVGMATALRDDLAENMEAVRQERAAFRTELVAHCETAVVHCQQETVNAVTSCTALHSQSLVELESNLRRDVTNQLDNTHKDLSARFQALANTQQATEAQALALCTRQAARTDEIHAELSATLNHTMEALVEKLESKTAALQHELRDQHMNLLQRLSVAVQRLALCEVKSVERHDLLKNALVEMALKLVKEHTAVALGPTPSIPDVLAELGVQRVETAHVLVRLEEETAALLSSCTQLQGSIQALATRDNHWVVLDARLHEHYQNLVNHCLVVIVRPLSSSSSPPSSGPEQLLNLQGRALLLKKETQDVIATHSYRIAKTIALKADYDVIRNSMERKDPLTDEECDASILQSRETYLTRFLDAVRTGADKAIAVEGTGIGVRESLAQFNLKLEQAIRLALSKFSRIHVGRSLFGKISPETQVTCLSCDRSFVEEAGQLLRRTLLKKPATANIITTNTAPTGANTGPRRASLYHANASGFKTFSFVKETDVLKNVLKEQRDRQPVSRGIIIPSKNTLISRTTPPTTRLGRRATSYTGGSSSGHDGRNQKLPNIDVPFTQLRS